MNTLQKKRSEYCQDLEEALHRIVERLKENPAVEKVLLFGSYAKGRRDLFTDLDLVVVMESKADFVQRTAELQQGLRTGVDVDLLVYTPEEFERSADHGFLRQVMRQGQVVYEKGTD